MNVHHIDSNIFLGILVPDNPKYMKACKEYIDSIGYKYEGHISIFILGEIHRRIYTDLKKDKLPLSDAIDFIDNLIRKDRIKIETIRDEDMALFFKLREEEKLAHTVDLLALSIAINRKAHVFMTGDKALLESEKLRRLSKEHGLAIQMPEGLPINLRL